MIKKLILPVIFTVFLCSCYDSTEIDELAYVVALGVDKGEQKNYNISFQYAVPLNISGGVDSEGGDGSPLALYSFEADSIQSALPLADSKIAKQTDLSHLKLIVFSENVAKSGISNFKKNLDKSFALRPDTNIAVSVGPAKECLNSVSSPLELNPSRYYQDFFEKNLKNTAKSSNFSAPLIKYGDTIETFGTAVFKNDNYVFSLTPKETLIYKIATNEFTNLKLETEKGIFRLDSELMPKFRIRTSPLEITVTLNLSGEPISGEDRLFSDENYAKKILTDTLKQEINTLFQKSKDENTDIFGIEAHTKKLFLTEEQFESYSFQTKYKTAVLHAKINFRNTLAGE